MQSMTAPMPPEADRIGHAEVALRPAALVVPVRQGAHGIEVFMMQRTSRAAFVPGVHVFPGGSVDAADAQAEAGLQGQGCDIDDAVASARLGLPQGGLGYWIAALRECFEEAGLLLARRPGGEWLRTEDVGLERWHRARLDLHAGRVSLAGLCRDFGAELALDKLLYLSHWITPRGQNRRFDTRFFLAEVPPGQVSGHDGSETVASAWVDPARALEAFRRGEFPLVFATRTTLEYLSAFATVDELLSKVGALRDIPPIMPRMARGSRGVQAVGPRDASYNEIARIDAEGAGRAYYDIEPGRPVTLAPGVIRLTAPNPGYMTGPGTNTYLLGDTEGVTVIDPGPALPEHVAAILACAPGPIRQVLVTHTHSDHSPAVRLMRERAEFQALGWAPRNPGQDAFEPDHEPCDGERIATRAGTLRVLHTPGHAANHLCFLLEEQRLLFTGDHIMQGSTVVINPPDGDMAIYLASLERLLHEPIDWLAPAHGFTMEPAATIIRELIDHRLRREALVLRALQNAPDGLDAEALLARVYTQLAPPLKPVAARSLRAHLLKLQQDGQVSLEAERWWASR
ncbi:MAG: MBL fold metallo-hydrolase [Pigmentiphaga sp.]